MWLASGNPRHPHVADRKSTGEGACRCGTRIASGHNFLEVVDLRPTLSTIIDSQKFCSVACVRAWFLERLNEFDQLDTPENEQVVTDLRTTFAELAAAFAAVLANWDQGQTPSS